VRSGRIFCINEINNLAGRFKSPRNQYTTQSHAHMSRLPGEGGCLMLPILPLAVCRWRSIRQSSSRDAYILTSLWTQSWSWLMTLSAMRLLG